LGRDINRKKNIHKAKGVGVLATIKDVKGKKKKESAVDMQGDPHLIRLKPGKRETEGGSPEKKSWGGDFKKKKNHLQDTVFEGATQRNDRYDLFG